MMVPKDGERVKLFACRFLWQRLGCGGLVAIAALLAMAVFAIVCAVLTRDLEPFLVVGAGSSLLLLYSVRSWRIERRHLLYASIAFSEDGMIYWDGPGPGHPVPWDSIGSLRETFTALVIEYKANMGHQALRLWHHRLWIDALSESVIATIRERAELRCATRVHTWLHGLIWSPVVYRRCHSQPEERLSGEP